LIHRFSSCSTLNKHDRCNARRSGLRCNPLQLFLRCCLHLSAAYISLPLLPQQKRTTAATNTIKRATDTRNTAATAQRSPLGPPLYLLLCCCLYLVATRSPFWASVFFPPPPLCSLRVWAADHPVKATDSGSRRRDESSAPQVIQLLPPSAAALSCRASHQRRKPCPLSTTTPLVQSSSPCHHRVRRERSPSRPPLSTPLGPPAARMQCPRQYPNRHLGRLYE